jgi:hypothetical protein
MTSHHALLSLSLKPDHVELVVSPLPVAAAVSNHKQERIVCLTLKDYFCCFMSTRKKGSSRQMEDNSNKLLNFRKQHARMLLLLLPTTRGMRLPTSARAAAEFADPHSAAAAAKTTDYCALLLLFLQPALTRAPTPATTTKSPQLTSLASERRRRIIGMQTGEKAVENRKRERESERKLLA